MFTYKAITGIAYGQSLSKTYTNCFENLHDVTEFISEKKRLKPKTSNLKTTSTDVFKRRLKTFFV